ncbi:hypothetical protein [Streptomyces capuensis]|uniref:hypothetical protein n=1 Tax=Streptomyces capuensis TaxID=1464056 RepID=UPI0004BE601F|nr:hypothetical protein [Streptomyces capuensis]
MPEPRYDARTVEAPDGTRITVAYKPGTDVEYMSDAEFLATFHPDKMRRTVTVEPPADRLPRCPVTDLALERINRHPPGVPYTAADIAPLFGGKDVQGAAERIAALLNIIIDQHLR